MIFKCHFVIQVMYFNHTPPLSFISSSEPITCYFCLLAAKYEFTIIKINKNTFRIKDQTVHFDQSLWTKSN